MLAGTTQIFDFQTGYTNGLFGLTNCFSRQIVLFSSFTSTFFTTRDANFVVWHTLLTVFFFMCADNAVYLSTKVLNCVPSLRANSLYSVTCSISLKSQSKHNYIVYLSQNTSECLLEDDFSYIFSRKFNAIEIQIGAGENIFHFAHGISV